MYISLFTIFSMSNHITIYDYQCISIYLYSFLSISQYSNLSISHYLNFLKLKYLDNPTCQYPNTSISIWILVCPVCIFVYSIRARASAHVHVRVKLSCAQNCQLKSYKFNLVLVKLSRACSWKFHAHASAQDCCKQRIC